MIAKISRLTFLSKILIISYFSVMHASDQTLAAIRKERMDKTIQPPIWNPTSNTHSQQPITITPICTAPPTGNHTLPTSVPPANKINSSEGSMPISLNILGTPYPIPTLPPQIAADYAWSDMHILRNDIDYVLGLIKNGTYQLAYNQGQKIDTKLPGRNSNGLRAAINMITERQQAQRMAHTKLLNQHRTQTTIDCNDTLLLLFAINANFHPKKIDMARLEEEFKNIQELRAANQQHTRLLLEESHAKDEHLKKFLEALHDAHLTSDTSLPVTPRKNLETFTKNILIAKK